MKRIRRQAHRAVGAPEFGFFRHPHLPKCVKSSGGTFIGRVKFYAQLQRFAVQVIPGKAEVDHPIALVAGRHQLIIRLHPFADLAAHFRHIHFFHRAGFQAALQNPVRFQVDILFIASLLGGAAGDENFLAQLLLFRGRQFSCAPLQQAENAGAGKRQQYGIQSDDPQPFTEPDLPAGHRFGGDHLNLAFLDVPRQRSAREPERRKSQQAGDGAQGVGQNDLGEALRRAVILDHERQPDHRQHQQGRYDQE